MDKPTEIFINAGVGMINLTNKIWRKKFKQLIKDEKLQKDFGERFLAKLESKVKKSQKKYNSFIKIISKPKKKKKSKQLTVSKKAIFEFTFETFGKTNKIWGKGFEQLVKDGKLSVADGNDSLNSIDKSVKEYWDAYLKDMSAVISDSFGKKSNRKAGNNTPKKAFDSILGIVNLAKDSWKKNQEKQKESKTSEKDTNEPTPSLAVYDQRLQSLESKIETLLQEVGIIKEMCSKKMKPEIIEIIHQEEPIDEKFPEEETIVVEMNPEIIEKDDFKKIEGIGPKIESLLHNAGILSFTQLSNTQTELVKAILLEAGNRFKMHNPTTWGKQAALAAKGDWDALKKWQDELKGGK